MPGHSLFLSLMILIGAFLLMMFRFERKKLKARELVLLSVLAGVAAVSRIPFASLPSVQPTTFVIIVTGLTFGGESGFVVGCLAALVSNMMLGQGPWTPWQMFAWGSIGGAAGVMGRWKWSEWIWVRCLFGAIAGYLFGWVMNVWEVLSLHLVSFSEWFSLYAASFYFDSIHAICNVVLLALFSKSWIKILTRFKVKYGLLDKTNSGR
ncbi:ECF transporter S component [Pullulanibacillus sp. KACC 23026]|uniref:ECF transporter S component n=1 Tax=Pullulanibacillus sp. KACC 23026 TaxID=3028315 RepID=UPI0023B10FA6|nr:ECF transporter S component [Pullulanibacillus sp. KACC 23026]WEG15014.1 ECF transporter S component [Pullulanibacillus sp. KACC 23026]